MKYNMLKKFVKDFNKLPESNKSMIYLMWIYSAGGIIAWIFINIYVFSFNKEIIDVLVYNAIFFWTSLIWFSGIWYFMSHRGFNVKNMYYISYFSFILSFSMIFLVDWYLWIYLFWIIYWLWEWSFRSALHSQELVNIKDKNRDLYSSMISSWENIIKIVIPFLVSAIFFIVSSYFSFSPYVILFLLLPFIYVISFFFIKNIWNYTPKKIKYKDFKNFVNLKKYGFWHLYFIFTWLSHALVYILLPIIAISILKTETNVWLFEWIISLFSTFLVIFLSSKRNVNNRIKIMWILSFLLFINFIFFSFNFSLFWYIIFTLVALILNPLYRVSEHVFDLKLMETIKLKWSDFFPTMIFREIVLSIWSFLIIIIFIFLYNKWFTLEEIINIWLISFWLSYLLSWWSIALHMKYENEEK